MQADYIIAGGGGAGLSLLHHLLFSPLQHKRILVLDRESKETNDRTWCYWSAQRPRYQSAVHHTWDTMAFHTHTFSHTAKISPYTYYHIRSADFYQEVRELAASFSNVDIIQAEVYGSGETSDSVWVETSLGIIKASYLFTSVASLPSLPPHPHHTLLAQNFLGWRIKTAQLAFDPGVFTLMDFRAEDQTLPTFFYMLPYSESEALVEVTQFSPQFHSFEGFEEKLHRYITDQLGVTMYAIEEDEEGSIPMTSVQFPTQEGERIYRIGTVGGDTKPTTGYTFQNIQKHCKQIVAELQGKRITRRMGSRYRFLDRLLLHIMREEPEKVSYIMERLFGSTRWPTILRFLDEESHLLQELKMVVRLPWFPFLRALFSPKSQKPHVALETPVARERMANTE
ncbi:MAG TPA: lycopene cyclase [Cytophagales bacterium]|nr:lycopene cyclase [Cytophagales bacterium]HAP60006.1 lycopene cyclase [Cytophagales bacterium]